MGFENHGGKSRTFNRLKVSDDDNDNDNSDDSKDWPHLDSQS